MRLLLCILTVFSSFTALAGQTAISDYDTARDTYFWTMLYPDGGYSLYCNQRFEAGQKLTVEHAYPADWMAEAVGCENRDCDADGYGYMEADLHNLWPARGNINSSRGDKPFAEIPGEGARRFTDVCPDYERTPAPGAVVEPREAVKGDIARSLLYMSITYDLPLKGMGSMLIKWHRQDPPSFHELWRNDLIEKIQGTRNPFIDGM